MKIITASAVITGNPGEIITDGAVLIEGDQIVAVGNRTEVSTLPQAENARLIDRPDDTLLPGLIDSHVHLAFDASDAPVEHMMSAADGMLLALMLRNARALLSVGVTTARDLGAPRYLDLVVKEAVESGMALGPRLLVANRPITTTGGHCWFMGCERDDVASLRRAVREHHRAGADLIKVMVTGGLMTPGSSPAKSQFDYDEVRTIVDEARHLDKRVAAHVLGTPGIRTAVKAGVDTLEHCLWLGPNGVDEDVDLIAEIADKRISVCPTANARSLKAAVVPPLDGADTSSSQALNNKQDRWLRMHRAGVLLIAGTDAGINRVPHEGYVDGLLALAEAGLSHHEVLVAATLRAAEACGVEQLVGSIAAGKQADLVAVTGNPLVDLRLLRRPTLVMKAGQAIDAGTISTQEWTANTTAIQSHSS